jgi:hypothetical protein
MQSTVQMPATTPYHGLSNVMDFPMGDPFAYPLLPGVSLSDNELGALNEDILRLPLFNTHADIDELSTVPSASADLSRYPFL